MNLLYFWQGNNYRRDLDFGVGYHLNQGNPLLHEIQAGESLWAFTRRRDGRYVLAAELVVRAKTLNSRGFRYGRYRVWGDLRASRYFAAEGQPDLTTVIRRLSVKAGAEVLGRSFQGAAAVRAILPADHQALSDYSKVLPLEARARLLPEERLEAVLTSGDEEAVARLLVEEPAGIVEQRRLYLMSRAIQRDRQLVDELRQIYRGRCQVCGWSPRDRYATELCEAHHVRWLSRGGQDLLSNLVLICPNHHRAVHKCDAPFDFEVRAFIFSGAAERLELVEHQLEAD